MDPHELRQRLVGHDVASWPGPAFATTRSMPGQCLTTIARCPQVERSRLPPSQNTRSPTSRKRSDTNHHPHHKTDTEALILVVSRGPYRVGRRNWSIPQSRCTPEHCCCRSITQQLPDICHACLGRLADRPRLTSWGAGRGAGLACCERLGSATCWWRSAQTVVVVPAWSVLTEGRERGRLCVALLVVRPVPGRVGLFAAGMRRCTGPPGLWRAPGLRVGPSAAGACVAEQAHPA